jgi:hypothetical protein
MLTSVYWPQWLTLLFSASTLICVVKLVFDASKHTATRRAKRSPMPRKPRKPRLSTPPTNSASQPILFHVPPEHLDDGSGRQPTIPNGTISGEQPTTSG